MKLCALFLVVTAFTISSAAQSTYLGMDRNDYPGDAVMRTLHETFAFTGYWLNNPPGAKRNTWRGNRKNVEELGYGFLLLFNGREYAYLKASGNATRVGKNDAAAAVRSAEQEGFPKGAIIFLDQEQGGRMLPEQLASSWRGRMAWCAADLAREFTVRGFRSASRAAFLLLPPRIFASTPQDATFTSLSVTISVHPRKGACFPSLRQLPVPVESILQTRGSLLNRRADLR